MTSHFSLPLFVADPQRGRVLPTAVQNGSCVVQVRSSTMHIVDQLVPARRADSDHLPTNVRRDIGKKINPAYVKEDHDVAYGADRRILYPTRVSDKRPVVRQPFFFSSCFCRSVV